MPTSQLSTWRWKLLSVGRNLLLADKHAVLRAGDRSLLAGAPGVEGIQRRTLNDDGAFHYPRTG